MTLGAFRAVSASHFDPPSLALRRMPPEQRAFLQVAGGQPSSSRTSLSVLRCPPIPEWAALFPADTIGNIGKV